VQAEDLVPGVGAAELVHDGDVVLAGADDLLVAERLLELRGEGAGVGAGRPAGLQGEQRGRVAGHGVARLGDSGRGVVLVLGVGQLQAGDGADAGRPPGEERGHQAEQRVDLRVQQHPGPGRDTDGDAGPGRSPIFTAR